MAYVVDRCLLRELLKESDMTQSELADRLGITGQQINKYVNNRQKMSIEVAYNVSVILKCNIEDLYEWSRI